MSDEDLQLRGSLFKPEAAATEVSPERSGAIDLTDLLEAVEAAEDGEPAPPRLADSPSLLWSSVGSGLHHSLLSTSAPSNTAEAWQDLAEELATESRQSKDPQVGATLMAEAGRILVDRLGRLEEGQLLMRNSDSPVATTLLQLRSGGRDSLADELTKLEERARDASKDDASRAAAWVEFGLLCEEGMGNRQRALEAYLEALSIDEAHPEALALAAEAATLLQDNERARSLVNRQLEACNSPRVRVALLLELADLADDDSTRRELTQLAHEAGPREETTLRRLIRLVSGTGESQRLGSLYRTLADVSEDPLSASTALHLAFLTLIEANAPVDDLVRELAKRGAEDEASELVAPLSEIALYIEERVAAGRGGGLPENVAVLARVARSLDAPREQALVREQIARIRLQQIRELQATSPSPEDSTTGLPKLSEDRLALCDALEEDLRFCLVHLPEHRWVRASLAELLRMQGDVPGLILHLSEWARTQSAGPGRAAILLLLGDAHESLLQDLPRAAEVYELAVAEDPDGSDCLRALGRIYEKMRRWPQAITTLQRQARESDDTTDRVAILRRIASMAQQELEDVDLTIATLEEIAELDPDDLLALFQLAATSRTSGRTTILIETLERLVERLQDDVARTATLVELGEVLELQLKQRDRAREAYERALSMTPGYAPALRALARLYRDNGDLDALLSLHTPEYDSVTDPAVLALKAARVCLDEVGDLDRAIEYLWTAYRTNPDLIPARESLLQLLTVNGRIAEAYNLLRSQDHPEAGPLLADHHYRLGLLAEALARTCKTEDQAQQRHDHQNAALQHHRAALVAQPQHGLALERSRRLLVAHNDTANLVRLLQDQVTRHSGPERAVVLAQLGRLHASSGDGEAGLDRARKAYEEASQAAPADPIVRREYEVLLRHMNDTTSLPAVYLQTVRNCKDTHYRATLLVEATEILLGTGKDEDRNLAGSAILEALHADPGNPYAVRHLERLLSEPAPPLSATDAVGARAVRAQSDAERAVFYLESAELLEHAGAIDQARRAYQAAHSAIPGLTPAVLGLERLASGAAVAPPIRTRTTAPQQQSLHNLMAEARDLAVRSGTTGSAEDGARALHIIDGILRRAPDHRDAIALARALVQQLPDPAPAIALLTRVFPKVTDPDAAYELGILLGDHAGDLEKSADYLQRAVQAKPTGRQALRALVRCYRQMGRDSEAAAATEQLLELYGPDEPSAIDLRMGIAAFLGRDPSSLERALEHARIVNRARPSDPRVLSLMADLLERSGQQVDAARVLDRLPAHERDRGKLHERYLRQGRLLATSAAHRAEALQSLEKAMQINAAHRETITLYAQLLEQNQQGVRLREHLPGIRNAMTAKIARGAVSLRDIKLLAQVGRDADPDLSYTASLCCHAIEPTSIPPPEGYLRPGTRNGLRAILGNAELRHQLYAAGELSHIHALLQSVNLVLLRLTAEFRIFADDDRSPIPPSADPDSFSTMLSQWTSAVEVSGVVTSASESHNACLLLPGVPPEIRIGSHLWMQGDPVAWRGLAAIALARHAFGAALARALSPIDMDLLIAACFESVGVFNAITADPDPRRLHDLTAVMAKQIPRKQRKIVERACEALSASDLVPSATARATLATDLRLAALISGDISGVLGAACLLDGVAGGSLKQRINRSSAAQGLLVFLLHDDYPRLRAIIQGR
jgi:tetratricopeptide (TPR) repeat protein